ncbi:MAG: imidazolonepropionase-like amidohydrolase [Planctomycetota bacterium]|jgi:imidazolonepropionase-like amidohydrolase
MRFGFGLALTSAFTVTSVVATPAFAAGDLVLRAGTIHTVDGGGSLTGGAAVLIRDGLIVEIAAVIDAPAGARVIDYGKSAVIIPGLVAADSGYASGRASGRTAEPGLSALDGFDFYGQFSVALSHGVTSAYISPASGRLISGQGAIVKLGGLDLARRVISSPATIHGTVTESARRVPGFWEPPIPPTVDEGLGWAKPQLPHSLMGAVLAIEELLAGGQHALDEYGPYAPAELEALVTRGTTWRMGANNVEEIRALLDLGTKNNLSIIIDGGREAGEIASELASAGASVIFQVPFMPNSPSRGWGQSADDHWPNLMVPAELAAAGVNFAISHSGSSADLLFTARLASRGGLDPELALRAITLAPAELLGAADRVGSLAPGKDADILVMNGEPMGGGSVVATWLDGELAWSANGSDSSSSDKASTGSSAVLIEVEELHIGDGQVLRPGAMLMRNGRIVEVGTSISPSAGAVVVQGFAATPGMIDAYGYLGLEGSKGSVDAEFPLSRIIGPGDELDRRVALAGVTTVVLSTRGQNRSGTPMMPYKPAASDYDRQVIADPVTVRVDWSENNRLVSGNTVKGLLEKASEYIGKWSEYEMKLAEWEAAPKAKPKAKKSVDDEEESEEDEEKEEEPKKDSKKKKKKKKKGDDEEPEPFPVTGIWEGMLIRPPFTEETSIRIQLVNDGGNEKGEGDQAGSVEGSIRCSVLSDSLISIAGQFDGKELRVSGLGSQGFVELVGEPKAGELKATLMVGESEIEFEVKRTQNDVPRAERPVAADDKEEEAPKSDAPRPPKLDGKLEPFRRAMNGDGTILVAVDREDEILECVDAFAAAGIRPILYGATDLHYVADQVSDRIAGVLLNYRIVEHDREQGLEFINRYARIANAGIPIGFHSLAEEGAADLPLRASYAVAKGLSRSNALRALTADVAEMFGMSHRVGQLKAGLDADVLLFDGPPLDPASSVVHTWVNGEEISR